MEMRITLALEVLNLWKNASNKNNLSIITALRRFSSPRTKLLAARCECLHLIKMNCLAL